MKNSKNYPLLTLTTYFDITFTGHSFIKSSVTFKYGIPVAHVQSFRAGRQQKLLIFVPNIVKIKGVHLTLPAHIISVQVKSQSMLHHGSVRASLKQNKRNLKKPNPNP